MKRLLLLILLMLPLSCYDGLNDMYDNLGMKVPICVNSTTGDDANDGRGWANALATIQAAVNAANDGDEIWVAEGNYSLTWNITIEDSIKIYGGFKGNERRAEQRNPEINISGINGVSDRFVINSKIYVIFDGLTFTGFGDGVISIQGGADVTTGNCKFQANTGGGVISAIGSTYRSENCSFTGNSMAGGNGGAIVASNNSNITISNNTEFYGNSTGVSDYGGAIFSANSNLTIMDSFFGGEISSSGNSAGSGGAITFDGSVGGLIIKNTDFNSNSAASFGGAVYVAGNLTAEFDNCNFGNIAANKAARGGAVQISDASVIVKNSEFNRNEATTYGGGLSVEGALSTEVTNSYFSGNKATSGSGGGIYHTTGNISVLNSLLEKNESTGAGGAICSNGTVYLRNCTITDNNAQGSAQGGGIYLGSASATLYAYNSVIWGNTVDSGTAYNINTYSNCLIQPLKRCYFNGGIMDYSGSPNLSDSINSTNTPFMNNADEESSVYLRPNSELVDKGDNSYLDIALYSTDLAGNPRKVGTIDIGCYEKQ